MKSISCMLRVGFFIKIYLFFLAQLNGASSDEIKALDVDADLAFESGFFESSRPHLKKIIDLLSELEFEKPERGVLETGFVLLKSELRMCYIESKFGDKDVAYSHFLRAVDLGDDIGLIRIPQLSQKHRGLVIVDKWIDWEKKNNSVMDFDFLSSYARNVISKYE